MFPQSDGRQGEVSVGHDLRYVGSLDRRHATSFDPIEEIEQESFPRETPLHSMGCLRRTSDRTKALGRDTRDRPPWSCGHHRSAGSAELGEDAFGGFDHRRERSGRLGGETGGRCHLGPPTTNVAIWGREQCEASVRGNLFHPPSVGRVPRESHLADAGADPQPGLDIDLDELAQALMRRRRLPGIAFCGAVPDRGRAGEPQVPQRQKSQTRPFDRRVCTVVAGCNDRRREDNEYRSDTAPPDHPIIMPESSPDHAAPASRSGSLRPWRRAGC